VSSALVTGDVERAGKLLADEQGLVHRRTQRLQASLQDAAVLSTFPGVDAALAAFNIHVTPGGWAPGQEQQVKNDAITQAIRLENAFRSAGQPLLDAAGLTAPGAAFNAIMNEGDGIEIEYANIAGAKTIGGKIAMGTPTPGKTDWIANPAQFQIGHELGHAFNASMIYSHFAVQNDPAVSQDLKDLLVPYAHSAPLKTDPAHNTPWASGAFNSTGDPITYDDGGTTKVVIGGKQRNTKGAFDEQGMRTATQPGTGILRDAPFQQDLINDDGEWFADAFVNWSNGTLADNAQGAAISAWMDDHMQDWIKLALADKAK
jgi:hypothetical protein